MTDEPVDVQMSVDTLYDEMHENGTFPTSEKWPELVGTDNWNDAYSRYQTDHELPEEEREQLMAEKVDAENKEAPTKEE